MAKSTQGGGGGPASGTRSTAAPSTKDEALSALKNAKVITEDHEASSLLKLAEALQRHAQKAKPSGQQQIQVSNIDKRVFEAIAYLIKHYAEGAETTQEFFRAELEAAKEDLKGTIRSGLAEFRQHADHASASVMDIAKEVHTTLATRSTSSAPSYSSVVANGHPAGVDARTLARHSIQARQILFDQDGPNSQLSDQPDSAKAKETVQKILDNMQAPPDVKVRNITWTKESGSNRRRSVLIEMASDAAATWLRAGERLQRFSEALGAKVRGRSYKVLAKFIPITFDPDSHLDELCEANDIQRADITSVKWLKPTAHRKDSQSTAHAVIDFKTPEAANETITRGLAIAGRRLEVTKLKKEPNRCHKCYKYGHLAMHCKNDKDSCGRCGDETHPTRDCVSGMLGCIPCRSSGHPAWDRTCPTFIRLCDEIDKRNPENALPYYPTSEPWTWMQQRNPEPRAYGTGANDIPIPALEKARSQRAAKAARKEKAKETAAAKEAGVRFSNEVQCRLIGASQDPSQSNPVVQDEGNVNNESPRDWSAE